MSEETIRVTIDDAVLQVLLAKLDTSISKTVAVQRVTGGKGVTGGMSRAELRRLNRQMLLLMTEEQYGIQFGGQQIRDVKGFADFMKWQSRPMSYETIQILKNFKGATALMPKNFSAFILLNENMIKNKGILERLKNLDLPALNREMRILLRQMPGMTSAMRDYFNVKRLQRGFTMGMPQSGFALAAFLFLLAEKIKQLEAQIKQRDEQYYNFFLDYQKDLPRSEYENIREQSRDWLNNFLTRWVGR